MHRINSTPAVAPTAIRVPIDRDARRAQVAQWREEGLTWREVGRRLGVSGQRANQLFSKEIRGGGPAARRAQDLDALRKKVGEYLESYGPLPREVVAEEFTITPKHLAELQLPAHFFVAAKQKASERHFSDSQIHDSLNLAAASIPGSVLTAGAYSAWASQFPTGTHISLPGIYLRGSWRDACAAAGVACGEPRRSYDRRWDVTDVLEIVAEFVELCFEQQVTATYHRYDLEQRQHEDWPSGSTLRKLMGVGWAQIIQMSAAHSSDPISTTCTVPPSVVEPIVVGTEPEVDTAPPSEREHPDTELMRLPNAGRLLEFTGALIGTSTSQRDGDLRWTEMAMYRTAGGNYVTQIVGRSVIAHRSGCPSLERRDLEAQSERPGMRSCDECGHPPAGPVVYPELDRSSARVSETAAQAIASLYGHGDRGPFLTNVARRVIESACAKDDAIAGAYYVEVIA